LCYSVIFFFYLYGDPRDLHSFPTRRSSDLFVLITLLNVTLIILTLSVSRLLKLLLRLVAFLLFLNPQCLASISRWITASSLNSRSEERFSRNAETDLVCRLLLEKKKKLIQY